MLGTLLFGVVVYYMGYIWGKMVQYDADIVVMKNTITEFLEDQKGE